MDRLDDILRQLRVESTRWSHALVRDPRGDRSSCSTASLSRTQTADSKRKGDARVYASTSPILVQNLRSSKIKAESTLRSQVKRSRDSARLCFWVRRMRQPVDHYHGTRHPVRNWDGDYDREQGVFKLHRHGGQEVCLRSWSISWLLEMRQRGRDHSNSESCDSRNRWAQTSTSPEAFK